MINDVPEGPLRYFVRRIQIPRLSPFQYDNSSRYLPKCGLVLTTLQNISLDNVMNINNTNCNNAFMTPNEIPDLFLFLSENGYIIDTNITNMMNFSEVKLTNRNIICFFKYTGE
jgi:hypothetical protein